MTTELQRILEEALTLLDEAGQEADPRAAIAQAQKRLKLCLGSFAHANNACPVDAVVVHSSH